MLSVTNALEEILINLQTTDSLKRTFVLGSALLNILFKALYGFWTGFPLLIMMLYLVLEIKPAFMYC